MVLVCAGVQISIFLIDYIYCIGDEFLFVLLTFGQQGFSNATLMRVAG